MGAPSAFVSRPLGRLPEELALLPTIRYHTLMSMLVVDKFGRVLIPKAVRARHGWAPGTALVLAEDLHSVRLESLSATPESAGLMLREGHLVFESEWLAPEDCDPVRDAIEVDRAERAERVSG